MVNRLRVRLRYSHRNVGRFAIGRRYRFRRGHEFACSVRQSSQLFRHAIGRVAGQATDSLIHWSCTSCQQEQRQGALPEPKPWFHRSRPLVGERPFGHGTRVSLGVSMATELVLFLQYCEDPGTLVESGQLERHLAPGTPRFTAPHTRELACGCKRPRHNCRPYKHLNRCSLRNW